MPAINSRWPFTCSATSSETLPSSGPRRAEQFSGRHLDRRCVSEAQPDQISLRFVRDRVATQLHDGGETRSPALR